MLLSDHLKSAFGVHYYSSLPGQPSPTSSVLTRPPLPNSYDYSHYHTIFLYFLYSHYHYLNSLHIIIHFFTACLCPATNHIFKDGSSTGQRPHSACSPNIQKTAWYSAVLSRYLLDERIFIRNYKTATNKTVHLSIQQSFYSIMTALENGALENGVLARGHPLRGGESRARHTCITSCSKQLSK